IDGGAIFDELLDWITKGTGLELEPHPEYPNWLRFNDSSGAILMKGFVQDADDGDIEAMSLFLEVFAHTSWDVTDNWPVRIQELEASVLAWSRVLNRHRNGSGRCPLDRAACATLVQMVDVYDIFGGR